MKECHLPIGKRVLVKSEKKSQKVNIWSFLVITALYKGPPKVQRFTDVHNVALSRTL